MAYLFAAISAIVTGSLFALGALSFGVQHKGILFALGIIGAGLQAILLIGWYLRDDAQRQQRHAAIEIEPEGAASPSPPRSPKDDSELAAPSGAVSRRAESHSE